MLSARVLEEPGRTGSAYPHGEAGRLLPHGGWEGWRKDALVGGDTTNVFFDRVTCSTQLDCDIYRLDV